MSFSLKISPLFFILLSCFYIQACFKKEAVDNSWLLALGEEKIFLQDYKDAYRIAESSYSPYLSAGDGDNKVSLSLHKRLLFEFSEFLILEWAAENYSFALSEEELKSRLDKVRGSYPEEELEDMLLKSFISKRAWEAALIRKLKMAHNVRELVIREFEPEYMLSFFPDYCAELDKTPEDIYLDEELLDGFFDFVYKKEGNRVYEQQLKKLKKELSLSFNARLFYRFFPDAKECKDLWLNPDITGS